MLCKRGSRSCESLLEEQGVLMHEAKRHKLGEAVGVLLDVAEHQDLIDPVLRRFDVAVHEGRCAANAKTMRGGDDVAPLIGRKLVAREDVAHLIVENLRGCSRQSVESVVAQHLEVIGQRHAGKFDTVDNFHRRERVAMHPGNGMLYGAQYVAVIKRRQIVRQASLNADFSGAELPRFASFLRNLIEAEEVGVVLARPSAERAKLAADETDVRKVDVA